MSQGIQGTPLEAATDTLPPYCPEAERCVLGCCLLDFHKVNLPLKAGVTPRWFYETRHAELFNTLCVMAANGGGDLIVATFLLRERGKLESVGGVGYLVELQDGVPTAENLDYYIPELRDYFQRRVVLDAATRLKMLAVDPTAQPASVLADENSATDITALLQAMENLAVTTGAAVAMAGHFAKGNAAAKETIDRISGSGVFARDPDSLITFTKHEEKGAFAIEMVLRNLPPVEPFVVKWDWPLFQREDSLDPTRLKQAGGRPPKHSPEDLLECLGNKRLKTGERSRLAKTEFGVSESRFFALLTGLQNAGKVFKSIIDGKWEQTVVTPETQNL